MGNKAQIIIEFKTNKDGVFSNVHKYSSFLNHLISEHLESAFYIENIDNGVIYFFKNFKNFCTINLPYDKSIVDEFISKKEKKNEKFEIVGQNLYPDELKKNFPEEGIIFYHKTITGPIDKIIPMSISHFKSYDEKNIEIVQESENTLKMTFKTEKALETYLYERVLLTIGLIEEYIQN